MGNIPRPKKRELINQPREWIFRGTVMLYLLIKNFKQMFLMSVTDSEFKFNILSYPNIHTSPDF